MIDERGFVLVQKEKERREREMERAELWKTFLFVVEILVDACSALKAQIVKVLKKCLRVHRNTSHK
jgi:hypothetical protein